MNHIKFKDYLRGESYILHEEIAIEGYVKATDIQFYCYNRLRKTQKIRKMIDKVVLISKKQI